jgi:hypothetical protein
MKLTRLDLKFIDFMARRPEHRRVIHQKLENSSDILVQSPGSWYSHFLKNFALFIFQFMEIALIFLRRSPPGEIGMIAFDTNINNLEDRNKYFQYNLPGTRVNVLSVWLTLQPIRLKQRICAYHSNLSTRSRIFAQ